MRIDPASLPPLADECRASVVIPAKDEAGAICRALDSLVRQRAIDGSAIDPRSFEIVVFCNDCTDRTAALVRWFASMRHAPRMHLIEASLESGTAHVGTARRALLDVACDRYLGAGRQHGILASTDADSAVDPHWLAWTIAEMEHVDAVAGDVEVASEERDQMLAPMRLLYDRERTYRRLLGEIEHALDPRPFDPMPRHDAFVGASFAVTAAAYRRAGGLPAKSRLEDQAFAQALQRIDARVRHSYRVRVATSARRVARVDGGFAAFIGDLAARGERRESFPVLAARRSIGEACARAAYRNVWRHAADAADIAWATYFFRLDARTLGDIAADATTFGAAFARALVEGKPRTYCEEPVEVAVAELRAALAMRKPAVPALARTASGAG